MMFASPGVGYYDVYMVEDHVSFMCKHVILIQVGVSFIHFYHTKGEVSL